MKYIYIYTHTNVSVDDCILAILLPKGVLSTESSGTPAPAESAVQQEQAGQPVHGRFFLGGWNF